ncbi:MAG: radical SAM protein [Planctomycetaceae bacterium]
MTGEGGRLTVGDTHELSSAPRFIRASSTTARDFGSLPGTSPISRSSEGCDRTCTFCSIPKMRGKHITKPIEQIIEEARELVADGVQELILVAQDTTYYGMDLYGEVRLVQLLKELEQVDGLKWLRLMYLYPVNFTDQLIATIAESERVIPYLDMPLQHISTPVLRRMQPRQPRADGDARLQAAAEHPESGAPNDLHHRVSRRDSRAV